MNGSVIALRALEETDLVLVRSWNFDPEVARYFTSRWPVSMVEQRRWFDRESNGTGKKRLIIEDKATRQAIGLVGVMGIDHLNRNCEIGITVGDRAYWGQAHATEAIQLTLQFLFVQLNMHLVYLRVLQDNERAIAFFKKVGFTQNGLLREMVFLNGGYRSWIWMSITESEFTSCNGH
jgi:RimJ/RimL family protein N-acetyltransferase